MAEATEETQGLEDLSALMGYTFSSPELLRRALTHKSYANENPQAAPHHNERLEFLGDAVLDFVVSDVLMTEYPELSEGDLSKLRAGMVSEAALAEIARRLQLGRFLLIGHGEELSGGREKDSILSDALEALLAAVYIDSRETSGVEAIQGVIVRLFGSRLEKGAGTPHLNDFKTELQELVQKRYKDTVRYIIVQEEGPDHDKMFQAAVYFHERELGRGSGRSKKQAEQAAARLALAGLQNDTMEAGR